MRKGAVISEILYLVFLSFAEVKISSPVKWATFTNRGAVLSCFICLSFFLFACKFDLFFHAAYVLPIKHFLREIKVFAERTRSIENQGRLTLYFCHADRELEIRFEGCFPLLFMTHLFQRGHLV